MFYYLLFLVSLLSINTHHGMKTSQKISKPKLAVTLSEPKYDQLHNDYTIHALYQGKQIGHINYGPAKNPYVPQGAWSIKSIRVDNKYLEQGVGFQLFSKAIELLKRKKVDVINIVTVPRIETLTSQLLTDIYLNMLEKIDPTLRAKAQVRPWPSDDKYAQILVHLNNH